MQVRLPGRRTIVAHAFPSTDVEFASLVSSSLAQAREATTDPDELREAVTRRLRRAYPNAKLVSQVELGSILPSEETWYAFRDSAIRAPSEQRDHLYALLAAARRTIATTEQVMRQSEDVAVLAGYARDRGRELDDTDRTAS